jgi:hypothetical protein
MSAVHSLLLKESRNIGQRKILIVFVGKCGILRLHDYGSLLPSRHGHDSTSR